MDIKIVSSITRLANYLPLGSYVIYTALETYSFSLGPKPVPFKTIVQTPSTNYTCYYHPEGPFTYTSCNSDQASALVISLTIGFFLAVFLSFLKQVPKGGTPPLVDPVHILPTPGTGLDPGLSPPVVSQEYQTSKNRKYRWGVIYAEGNLYYLDFGDFHIWGHAALSFVAFGTLSLFSATVSQCLFPKVKPWIFVFTQVIMLVVCCFIAMFWIDDPSLSIGLMVVPSTDNHGTQTFNLGSVGGDNGMVATTSTSDLLAASTYFNQTGVLPGKSFAVLSETSTINSSSGLANNVEQVGMAVLSSTTSSSGLSSNMTAVGVGVGGGYGSGNISRLSMLTKRNPTMMTSVSEKEDLDERHAGSSGQVQESHISEKQPVSEERETHDGNGASTTSPECISLKIE